jgi:hypothetical protein
MHRRVDFGPRNSRNTDFQQHKGLKGVVIVEKVEVSPVELLDERIASRTSSLQVCIQIGPSFSRSFDSVQVEA